MPALRILIDNDHIATIRCNDFHVVSAHVMGSLADASFAQLEFTASIHPEKGDSTYLIWVTGHEIKPGQKITVWFLEDAETTGRGRTIDELYPNESVVMSEPDIPLEAIFQELRNKPNVRSNFTFVASTPSEPNYLGAFENSEFSFGFHALWNWLNPERVGISLSTSTIDSIELRAPGRDHFREYITYPQSVEFQVNT
jgi:hypothetical protein